jgi:putative transposase
MCPARWTGRTGTSRLIDPTSCGCRTSRTSRPDRDQLIHHSGRGSQYVSSRDTERLAEVGIDPSAGSRSDRYDNALAETVNGLYKAKLIHWRGPWRRREALDIATSNWVSWLNHHQLVEALGYLPPAEAEANYYQQLSGQPASEG